MHSKIEHRKAEELRLSASGRKLHGYAATFGKEARISRFTETILPGAFRASLDSGRDILALVDHDMTRLLARTKTGSLRLYEDAKGLAFELDLPDTQAGRDVLALAERGDLGGMSFGFTIPEGGEEWNSDLRKLMVVTLHEISVVSAWPAYEGTEVHARSRTPRLNRLRRFLETI